MQLVTGMVGSLEHSIAVDKMTVDGDLWKPDVEDETLKRFSMLSRSPYISISSPWQETAQGRLCYSLMVDENVLDIHSIPRVQFAWIAR